MTWEKQLDMVDDLEKALEVGFDARKAASNNSDEFGSRKDFAVYQYVAPYQAIKMGSSSLVGHLLSALSEKLLMSFIK
ncbi:AEL_HP2_G0050300.mRNA.1.CDS.1 [Saccharomyces cerevisiae]|nr:AEL_HP2_G0050300.mRNA.1.CDS.1 [Saccharomyces cerevisiae]CAI6709761.1 AEL_HP2_G0050300.mRNA.1.CDS.1 [Saccharomyces cerevisiae]